MAISREDRAKQFLPFDALKGFQKALREKEIEYVEKKELSQEILEEISETLKTIEKGDTIKVVYYTNRQYKETIEKVKEISKADKKIILYGDKKINFADILKISNV